MFIIVFYFVNEKTYDVEIITLPTMYTNVENHQVYLTYLIIRNFMIIILINM